MNWNYRVFLEENDDYIIREVFYDADGSILGCTENAAEPSGRSLEELAQDIEWLQEALALPVLTLADIPHQTERKHSQDRRKNVSREQLMAELGLDEPPEHQASVETERK